MVGGKEIEIVAEETSYYFHAINKQQLSTMRAHKRVCVCEEGSMFVRPSVHIKSEKNRSDFLERSLPKGHS